MTFGFRVWEFIKFSGTPKCQKRNSQIQVFWIILFIYKPLSHLPRFGNTMTIDVFGYLMWEITLIRKQKIDFVPWIMNSSRSVFWTSVRVNEIVSYFFILLSMKESRCSNVTLKLNKHRQRFLPQKMNIKNNEQSSTSQHSEFQNICLIVCSTWF